MNQPLDVRVGPRLGDDGATVGVTVQDNRSIDRFHDRPHPVGVTVEIEDRTWIVALTGQVDCDHLEARRVQTRHDAIPRPRPMRGAVHQHQRRRRLVSRHGNLLNPTNPRTGPHRPRRSVTLARLARARRGPSPAVG